MKRRNCWTCENCNSADSSCAVLRQNSRPSTEEERKAVHAWQAGVYWRIQSNMSRMPREDSDGCPSYVSDDPADYPSSTVPMIPFPQGQFDVLLADCPWMHTGDPNKDQAAGKHYALMTQEALAALNVRRQLAAKNAVLFLWATCPRLPEAIETMRAWDFHYRGVAFVWVKTSKAGKIISGQGVRPTVVKPTIEMVLVGTTCKTGRPLPLLDEGIGQVVWDESVEPEPVLASRPSNVHSRKPPEVRRRIEQLFHPSVRRIELFARERFPGWTAWGNEVKG